MKLEFDYFQEVNRRRCEEAFGHGPGSDWGIVEWALAICGEAGELANLIKKVRRGDFPLESVRQEVLKEIADIISYADCAMTCMGANTALELMLKFDEVSNCKSWDGPRFIQMMSQPYYAYARKSKLEIWRGELQAWWYHNKPALPHKFFDRDDHYCSLCGEFGPIAGRGDCCWSLWLRFLSLFKHRLIMPDCPEGKRAQPLMTRFKIYKSKRVGVFVQRFHRSDVDSFHDHPWHFLTFLLSSGYWEHTPLGGRQWKRRFSLLFRRGNDAHYIEIEKPLWTIFIRFKRWREWGFFTETGWVNWRYAANFRASKSLCEDAPDPILVKEK